MPTFNHILSRRTTREAPTPFPPPLKGRIRMAGPGARGAIKETGPSISEMNGPADLLDGSAA